MLGEKELCVLDGLRQGIVTTVTKQENNKISSLQMRNSWYETLRVGKVQRIMDSLVDDNWLIAVSEDSESKTYSLSHLAIKKLEK